MKYPAYSFAETALAASIRACAISGTRSGFSRLIGKGMLIAAITLPLISRMGADYDAMSRGLVQACGLGNLRYALFGVLTVKR